MKIPAPIISLLVAVSVPLAASAAVALPSSASSSPREAAAAPIQVVKHRQSHHRVAPAAQDDNESYGASNSYGGSYNRNGGAGVDDWSQWSPSHHPGWPCIGSGSEGNETSAYPTWELKPQCK